MTKTNAPLELMTTGYMPPEKVLHGALEAELEQVIVIGWKDGEMVAFGSTSDTGDILVMVKRFKEMIYLNASPSTPDKPDGLSADVYNFHK